MEIVAATSSIENVTKNTISFPFIMLGCTLLILEDAVSQIETLNQ